MGFLIDTNVWSELQKRDRTDPNVARWYRQLDASKIYLSALVVGEVRRGIELLRRRDPEQAQRLELRLVRLKAMLGPRILPITPAIAERWGHLNVPDPLPVVDALLAATAIEHGLILVTRNVRDVVRTGVSILNPFDPPEGR
jgi:toxin FitB